MLLHKQNMLGISHEKSKFKMFGGSCIHLNCFHFSSQLSLQVSLNVNCLNMHLCGLSESSTLSPAGSGSWKAKWNPCVRCSPPCSPGWQRHQATPFSQRGGNEIACLWWRFWFQFPGVSISKGRTNNLTSMHVLLFFTECYESHETYICWELAKFLVVKWIAHH